jgi:hypothetical protein
MLPPMLQHMLDRSSLSPSRHRNAINVPVHFTSLYDESFSAALLAFDPLSFFCGDSFFERWDLRIALARATDSARRSDR